MNKFNRLWHQTRGSHSNYIGGHPKNTDTVSSVTLTAAISTMFTTTTTTQLDKWVKNLSAVPITKAQASILAHGPNFIIAPRHPPYEEGITAVEQMCQSLEPHEAEEPSNMHTPCEATSQEGSQGIVITKKRPVKSHPHSE